MLDNKIIDYKRKNKKAQVGETLTWIVATLIIIGTLLIFIYVSIALAKSKSLGSGNIKNTIDSQILNEDVDWIKSKNELAFFRKDDNRNRIERWLNEKQAEETGEE